MKTSCCKTNNLSNVSGNLICMNEQCSNYLSKASFHRDYSKWKYPAAFMLFGFYLMFSFDNFSMKNNNAQLFNYTPESNKEIPLTVENLKAELEKQEVLCADAVLAQMLLESGHLNSYLLKQSNNMLGMRYPFRRATKACGIYIPSKDTIISGTQEELKMYRKVANNYAVYATWQDAVEDYKLWQENCFDITEHYLNFLGKVYAEDEHYVKKIKQIASIK